MDPVGNSRFRHKWVLYRRAREPAASENNNMLTKRFLSCPEVHHATASSSAYSYSLSSPNNPRAAHASRVYDTLYCTYIFETHLLLHEKLCFGSTVRPKMGAHTLSFLFDSSHAYAWSNNGPWAAKQTEMGAQHMLTTLPPRSACLPRTILSA
jgi:hypothetical protein